MPTSGSTSSSTMRGKEQDTVDRGRRRRHRRGRQARRHDAPATCSRAKGTTVEVEPFEPPEPVLAVAIQAQVEGRRGQARQRAAPPPGRRPGAAHRAQPRDAPDAAAGAWARRTSSIALEKLARKFGVEVETEDVQVAYRETITGNGRGRGQATRSRPAATASSASRSLRVEPLERGARLRVRRRDRRRRDPAPVHPRGREGRRTRPMEHGRRARLPGRRREGHVLRRQAPPGRQLRDGFKMAGVDRASRRRWRRPARSCSSRSASSS